MIRMIVRLAIVALVANATWRVGSAYAAFYRLKDSVHEAALHSAKGDEDLRQRIVGFAAEYDVPLVEDSLTIRHDGERHTIIEGSCVKPIELFPGYEYPWRFTLSVDAFVIKMPKLNELTGS